MIETAVPESANLDRPGGRTVALDWEKVAWAAIVVLTLVTRLYDLGDRAMSHDESLHTYYAWKLYFGQGYQHDPMMHGPLLFHATALSYLLFGVSDFTARLFAVATGLGLVLSPLLLRKWLGRVGAVATAVMLLVSPTVMYYSRYIRHDIQVELATVLMFIGFVRFVDSRANRWIVLAFTGAAIGVTSAEMSYITGFVLVLSILSALLAERLSQRTASLVAVVVAGAGIGLLVFASLAVEGNLASFADFTTGTPKSIKQVSLLASGLLMVFGLLMLLLARFRSPAPPDVAAPDGDAGADDGAGDARGGLVLADLVVGNLSLVLLAVGALALAVGGYLAAGNCAADAAAGDLQQRCRLGAAIIAGGGVVLVYGLLGWLLEGYRDRALASAIARARIEGIVGGVVVFAVIYVLLFTTFFTNWAGYMEGRSGFLASVKYWWAQHDVVRGDQPFYYYALFAPMYEYLPLVLSLAAAWRYIGRPGIRAARGNDGTPEHPSATAALFVPLLMAWAAGVFWIFSWAGEKMPWLLVHLVVPMAFLAGRWVADTVDAVDWPLARVSGWKVAALAALAYIAAGFLVVQLLMADSPAGLSRAAVGGLLLAAIAWGIVVVARGAPRRQAQALGALALAAVLLVANTRISLVANFVNDEDATEYIVYAHGTPDDKDVYEMLKDMQARRGETVLRIGYDNEVSWPFTWYFREDDWPQTPTYLGETPSSAQALNDLDVVMVGSPNYGKFEPYLRKDFASYEYRRMWWPNEGYKGFSFTREGWEKLRENLSDPNLRRNWLNILLYRKYTEDPRSDTPKPKSMYDWYHHANMKVFIKRDLIAQIWPNEAERPAGFKDARPDEALESVAALTVPIDKVFETDSAGQPLKEPKGVALDAAGNLYVADSGNFQIVEFSPDGVALASFGTDDLKAATGDQSGGAAFQASAWGVAVGPDGAVYVADTWNHRVVKYVDGRQALAFGTYGTPADPTQDLGQFWGPRDIAVDDRGQIYVTDTGNKRIQVFDVQGKPIRAYGGTGLAPGQFNEPTSIAFDAATGEFYVADLWNLRVQVFDRDFNFLREFPVDGWDSQDAPFKAYLAVAGDIVAVTDPAAARVWLFDRQGKPLGTLDLPMDDRGLKEPIGIEIDAQGRIYVASSVSGVVTRYQAPQGLAVAPAGSDGAASPATGPTGDAASATGGSAEATAAGDAAASGAALPSPTATGGDGAAGAEGAAGAGGEGAGSAATTGGGINAPSPPAAP